MSYEGKMFESLGMPSKKEVENALLISLFEHNGIIKEFGTGEEIVEEISRVFDLTDKQRNAYLETIYRKENRTKKSLLWHRLLFRAADSLAKEKLVSRPTETLKLTSKREWMLTEKGFDKALKLLDIPIIQKKFLPTKSYEVQKLVNKIKEAKRPENYNPFDDKKKVVRTIRKSTLRVRSFRLAITEAYNFKCAVCGMRINSPDSKVWEVEAAHIVPHSSKGRDDVWNGLALCRFHHWAFDVGWFTLLDNYNIQVSKKAPSVEMDLGRYLEYEPIGLLRNKDLKIFLPRNKELYPHQRAINWHRENIFFNK